MRGMSGPGGVGRPVRTVSCQSAATQVGDVGGQAVSASCGEKLRSDRGILLPLDGHAYQGVWPAVLWVLGVAAVAGLHRTLGVRFTAPGGGWPR